MRTTEITLPNGLVGPDGQVIRAVEVRKLNGEDEELLLDKAEIRSGNVINSLMKNCIVRLGDITDKAKIAQLYLTKFLVIDLSYLLIELRRWGTDNLYSFDAECPRCGREDRFTIPLDTLKVTPQKEEFRGMEEFTEIIATDEEDIVVTFRPLYVSDQKMQAVIKEQYPKERATRDLMLTIKQINGAPPKINDVKKWSMGTRNLLRHAMDSKFGGVDARIVCTCKKCENPFKIQLPMDVTSFFYQAGDLSNLNPASAFHGFGPTLSGSDKTSDGAPAKLEN
jgi:hypothetical protein